jgi:hypothetical protein
LDAFLAAFAALGYFQCADAEAEPDFERIALSASARGTPLHAARQRPDGSWSSKVGELEDIEHALSDLEGEAYGSVVLFMKRPWPIPPKE